MVMINFESRIVLFDIFAVIVDCVYSSPDYMCLGDECPGCNVMLVFLADRNLDRTCNFIRKKNIFILFK